MKNLTTTVLVVALAGIGMGVMTPVLADQHGRHSKGMGMGMMHRADSWKASLTEEQQNQVAKLKLDYKKKVYPIKAKIKQARIELALLMTTNKPSQKSINNKIDQIVKVKAEKMRLKAKHKIEVRKVLNKEQRVKFDLKILKKAYRGKKRGHYGHRR